MILRCLLIDDEPLARRVINEYIDDTEFLELAGEVENPIRGMDILGREKVDLIFLDIQMPKMNGLNFLRSYKDLPPVILITAFGEHALESYELEVIDYLVKPVLFERFLKAVTKAKDYVELKAADNSDLAPAAISYIFVKSSNRLEKLYFDDILFIEGMSNYIIIHTETAKIIAYLTMRSIMERLPATKFIQIHRSYIISLEKISSLNSNQVWIKDKLLPVSKSYKDHLMSIINDQKAKR